MNSTFSTLCNYHNHDFLSSEGRRRREQVNYFTSVPRGFFFILLLSSEVGKTMNSHSMKILFSSITTKVTVYILRLVRRLNLVFIRTIIESVLDRKNCVVLLISNDHINWRMRFNGTLKILLFTA